MNNRTPGPWNLRLEHSPKVDRLIIFKDGGEKIAKVFNHGPFPTYPSALAQANAKLISAAPDLLDALKYIRDECTGLPTIARALADKAISKAEWNEND
jgi:hypothetical protein